MTRWDAAALCGVLMLPLSGCDGAGTPLSPPPPSAEVPAPPPPAIVEDGSLEGTLLDARGDGTLSGRVVVTGADGRTWSDQAALDGWFHVRGLPRGEWVSVEARAVGVATSEAEWFEVPLVGAGQTGPLRMAATGDLRVLVADDSGAPVEGASVAVRRPLSGNLLSGPIALEPWPEAARATTAADGSTVLKDLPPGKWAMCISAPGRARTWENFEHAGGNDAATRSAVLRPGHAFEGRVLLPGGKPAPGAVVAALEWNARASESMTCVTTVADGEGRFRLEGLGAGRYPILVRAFPGVLEPAGTVKVPAARPQDLRLGPRAAMEGSVSDGNRPVAGAIVRWVVSVSGEDRENRRARVEVRTDGAGCYRVPSLPAGTVMFFGVRAAGFLPYPDSFSPRDLSSDSLVQGRTLRADAAVHRGAAVSGVVRDLNGAPVRNAWLQVETEAENRFCADVPSAWTDAKGRYLVPSAHPGKAELRSRGSGLHSRGDESCAVAVPKEGEVVKDLVLLPDARVRGHVRFADGTPAAGFLPRVVDRPMENGYEPTVVRGTRTSETGEFHMWVDRPGKGLRVVADGPGGLTARSEPFDLEAAQLREGLVAGVAPGARISGTVRREDGGALRCVALRVVPDPGIVDEAMRRRIRDPRSTRTVAVREDGTFTAEGLAAGEYSFSCTAEGCSEGESPRVKVADGEHRTGVEVVLPRGWEIGGVVASTAGEPLAGAKVFVSRERKLFDLRSFDVAATTDAEGRFRIGGLADGRFDIRASLPGHPDQAVTVDAGAMDARIVLEPGFSIAGKLVDAETGHPVGGIEVSAWPREDLGSHVPSRPETTSDADGTFRLDGLRAGRWDVRAGQDFHPFGGGLYPTKTVRGVASGTTDLVIKLERGRCIAGRIVDPEGRPIDGRGLAVEIRAPSGGQGWASRGGAIARDGTFAFDGLAQGRYEIVVKSSLSDQVRDATWLLRRIEGVAAGTGDLTIILQRGRAISGRIEGAPPEKKTSDFWVSVGIAGSPKRVEGHGYSNLFEDGTFVTGALEEGRLYDLSARVRNDDRRWVARGVAAGAEGVVLRPEPLNGAISGTVMHLDGGVPLTSGIPVRAEAVDSTLLDVEVKTTEGGRFAFEKLGTVAYRIRAGGPGSEFAWDGAWQKLSAGATNVVLRVRRGEILRGTLLGADGGPTAETLVLFVPGGDGEEVRHVVDVGPDGKFEVSGLPAGPVRLILHRFSRSDRQAPEVARVRVPCAPLDLRVPKELEED